MKEGYLEALNNFIVTARSASDQCLYLAGNTSLSQFPGVHFFKSKPEEIPGIEMERSAKTKVIVLGQEWGYRILEVPEGRIARADFASADAFFTWNLQSCIGIGARLESRSEGETNFSLAHLWKERGTDFSAFIRRKSTRFRITDVGFRIREEDLSLMDQAIEPFSQLNPRIRGYTAGREWNAMLVTREGITFLTEKLAVRDPCFEVCGEFEWKSPVESAYPTSSDVSLAVVV